MLLIIVSISGAVASERKECARQYATDLFVQKYGTKEDKDRAPKHGGNIHAFMQEFPQCKIAYGSNEQQLFQNAAAYAREEGMNYCPAQPGVMKPPISDGEEVVWLALVMWAGRSIMPSNKSFRDPWYCTRLGIMIAGPLWCGAIWQNEAEIRGEGQERWKATARAIVIELCNYNFTRERQENFSQIKSERAL